MVGTSDVKAQLPVWLLELDCGRLRSLTWNYVKCTSGFLDSSKKEEAHYLLIGRNSRTKNEFGLIIFDIYHVGQRIYFKHLGNMGLILINKLS